MIQTLWIPSKYFPPRPSVELITVAADPQWRKEKICRRRSSGAWPLRDGWSMEAIHEEGPVCNLPLNLFTSQSFNWSNVQLFKCSTVQMFNCSNVQLFKCSRVGNLLNLFTSQSFNWSPNNFRLTILLLLTPDLEASLGQASLIEFGLPKPMIVNLAKRQVLADKPFQTAMGRGFSVL